MDDRHSRLGDKRNGGGKPMSEERPTIIKSRRWRWLKWVLLGAAALLISVRLALPYFIEHYVNKQLRGINDYTGSIGTVRVHLWRGAYSIRDIRILKSDGKVPVPLFSAPDIDLAIQWKELFHGAIVGNIRIQNPSINFVQGGTKQQSQSGANTPWVSTLDSLFPFDINRLEVKDGAIHFQNLEGTNKVDVYVTNVLVVATNLSNARNLPRQLSAGLEATGNTLGYGDFRVDLRLNPQDAAPTFELNATVTNVSLTNLNEFLRKYAKLDVARGNLSLYTSIASVQGKYDGYVKVLVNNLEVFAWEKERKKNVLEIVWQAIAGTLAAGFKNHPHDQLATQIPITGNFSQPQIHSWAAVVSVLENAFIAALKPRIEPFVRVEDVEKKQEKAPTPTPAK
jgi:Domain of Unknown Function (DUF748)